MDTIQLKRIADAIEEILRLVKKAMEDAKKRSKRNNRRADVYDQDARTKLQHTRQQVPDWRQAAQGPRLCVLELLCPEGQL